ncbi:helix-turn-helix domain-containing protein [Saccharibacillus sp. CPCC 101409]|uniref:helix-turn-helix domain-containing protein n=1 Tax=Saccharibacillus sp. CPCC 101409 TaxID=3058041 RepID=UPI0026736D75|nr:helix-turn-helix domain-containing protein [Saccharibacillus sp. CPCC 101409]MDO3410318.1 helix-turn-helix domain-containing protein [Saccharibacillus sp. CPCC 101409]
MKPVDQSGEAAGNGPVFYLPKRIAPLEEERYLFGVRGARLSRSILLVTEGSGRIRLESAEAEREGKRGSVVLCAQETGVRLGGRLSGLLIEYAAYGEAVESRGGESLFAARCLDVCSPRIVRAAEELAGSWNSRLAQASFRTQRLFLELIELLNAECELSEGTGMDDWLPGTLDTLHEHYAEEWTRQRIAELAGVSEEHFSRSFRRRTGQTFIGYLTLLRIREVQRSLLLDDGSVQGLALRTGYRDGNELSRTFKRMTGYSPLRYKQAEKRIVSFNFNYTACLLALGVRPVLGAYSGWLLRTHPELPIDQRAELSIYGPEECRRIVRAAEPDVLIGYGHLNEERDWLTIAPAVGIPFMDMDWRAQFRQVAAVAGKKEAAEKLLAGYERKVRQLNKKLDSIAPKRGTAIVWELGQGCAYTFGTRFGRAAHILYDDLGFRFPGGFPAAEVARHGYAEVPLNRLREFKSDRIFVIGAGMPDMDRLREWFTAPQEEEEAEIYPLEASDLFYGFDPLSSLAQLDVLQEALCRPAPSPN